MTERIASPSPALYVLEFNPTGKPVVLLHGLGSSSSAWGFQIPALVEHDFRVLALDLPGFGKSAALAVHTNINSLVTSIYQWFQGIGLVSASLVGLSLGGVVALKFTLDFPDLVDKLVLVSSFAKFEPTTKATFFYMVKRFLTLQFAGLDAQAQTVARHLFPDDADEEFRKELVRQIASSDPKTYRSLMHSLAAFDVLDQLNTITCPTLVIGGASDTTVPLKAQNRLAASIPNAHQVVVPDAGHALPIQKPELFNQSLIHFLLEKAR